MGESISGFDLMEKLRGKSKQEKRSEFTSYLELKARDKGVPICGQFELTPLCNFDCKMCYVHLLPEQMKERSPLSVATWKDLMNQAWEAGMIRAVLTGGECLIYPAFDELFLYLLGLGVEVTVLTNGYLLNEERITFFKAHKPRKIQITLYGWNNDVYERVTGQRAFNTVFKNIQSALQARLPVTLCITPNTFLGEDVLETIRIGIDLGVRIQINSSIFTPHEDTGRAEQQADPDDEMYIRIYRMLNELRGVANNEIEESRLPPVGGPCHDCEERGFQCGGGRSAFVVNWQGELIPCNRMSMIRGYPIKEGFITAWEGINRTVNNWPRVPECNGCAYEEVCENCAANMLRFAKPGKQPIALCERTKKFIRHGVWQIPECE